MEIECLVYWLHRRCFLYEVIITGPYSVYLHAISMHILEFAMKIAVEAGMTLDRHQPKSILQGIKPSQISHTT